MPAQKARAPASRELPLRNPTFSISLRDYVAACREAAVVPARFSCCIALCSLVTLLQAPQPHVVASIGAGASMILLVWSRVTFGSVSPAASLCVLLFAVHPLCSRALHGLSPDTAGTLATVSLGIHLLFADYGLPRGKTHRGLAVMSGMTAALLLASHLDSLPSFALMLATCALLVLPPRALRGGYSILATGIAVFLSSHLSHHVTQSAGPNDVTETSKGMTQVHGVAAVCVHGGVGVVLPALYINLRRYKRSTAGGWDEYFASSTSAKTD
eukprot:m.62033 g.62033  ORF g.62033 m.62033 type:complete len:271 (+) comp12377_c0_seq1:103-915(+)